ncbi:MAG: hypothetical protein ACQERR_01505 [Pseudomonadota bacterium]
MNAEVVAAVAGAAVAGLLVGGYLGHWWTIAGQRRKELDYYAGSLFSRLEKQRDMVKGGVYPHDADEIDHAVFAEVKRRFSWLRRKRLDGAIDDFMRARRECGYSVKGIYQFAHPERLLMAIERLQRVLPNR